jgi:hypothetical protein
VSSARARFGAALAALAVLAGAACSSAAAPASAKLPSDFLGIVSSEIFDPLTTPYWKVQILERQRRAGVELLRQDFDWAQIEPRPGVFHFGAYDALLTATAKTGMRVLAVLDGPSPAWAEASPRSCTTLSVVEECPPRSMASFAAFAAAVVRRYGPGGSFWRSHPALRALPIDSWEIWNEPNFDIYWGGHPSAAAYASMLGAAAPAIRAVDRHAEIVAAGTANSTQGITPATYIPQLLARHPPFDTLAIHLYDYNPADVMRDMRLVRGWLDKAGYGQTPIWLTEFGWASGGPPSPFTVTPARQAQYVLQTIVDFARAAQSLHIRGIVYYDWQDEKTYAGGAANPWQFHTGLVSISGVAKPAQSAYYQAAGVIGALRATAALRQTRHHG